jgi:hypothetical protein
MINWIQSKEVFFSTCGKKNNNNVTTCTLVRMCAFYIHVHRHTHTRTHTYNASRTYEMQRIVVGNIRWQFILYTTPNFLFNAHTHTPTRIRFPQQRIFFVLSSTSSLITNTKKRHSLELEKRVIQKKKGTTSSCSPFSGSQKKSLVLYIEWIVIECSRQLYVAFRTSLKHYTCVCVCECVCVHEYRTRTYAPRYTSSHYYYFFCHMY